MSRKQMLLTALILSISLAAVSAAPPAGEGKCDSKAQITGSNWVDNTSYINANKILMFVTNHGNFGRDLAGVFGNDYGTYFPYISHEMITNGFLNKSPLYAAGLWLGGIDSASGQICLAVSEYNGEYVPGPMAGGTYLPDDPSFKIYKLYADSLESNPNMDYIDWPDDQGAPIDHEFKPITRGDQMLWTVYNDANPSQHINNAASTDPLGIEVQQTVWASDENGDDTIAVNKYLEVQQYGSQRIAVSVEVVNRDLVTGHDYMVVTKMDPDPYWRLIDVTQGSTVLDFQTDFTGSGNDTIEGMVIRVTHLPFEGGSWEYESAVPQNLSPVVLADDPSYTGGRWFSGASDGELLFGGVFLGNQFTGSNLSNEEFVPVQIDFRPMQSYTDLTANGRYDIGEPYNVQTGSDDQSAFLYSAWGPGNFTGFYPIPFTAWDVSDPMNPRQLAVVFRDRDQNNQWDLHKLTDPPNPSLPNDGDTRFNYVWIMDDDYNPAGVTYDPGAGGGVDFMLIEPDYPVQWVLWLDERGVGGMLAEEGSLTLYPVVDTVMVDTFAFTADPPLILTTGPEGVSIYIEYKLFNKGDRTLKNFFTSFWSDVDLGDAGDDFVGCDTLDDIFFTYNDGSNDSHYNPPPATGFKLIHGPAVPSPGDSAYYFGQWLPDYKNLPMTSFAKYINGTDPDTPDEIYNYMQGPVRDGSPYIYNNDTLKFATSGDPVTGQGDLDIDPADRRMMASCGPFDLRPGDSQYVLIKMVVGQGNDALNSITKMREILNLPFDFPTDADDDRPKNIPARYSLSQNFPNPFNPSTTIRYSVEKRSEVNIAVFNILGQQVTTLVNEVKPAGKYSVIWDGADEKGESVATGIYFYRIIAGDFTGTRQMLLLK